MELGTRRPHPSERELVRARVGIAAAAAVVTALALPTANALAWPLADAVAAGDRLVAYGVAFYALLIGCFCAVGFAVRLLAGVPDAWFAMFAGAFAGGALLATTTLLTGQPQGLGGVLAPFVGGIAGASAAGIFGGVGFGLGTLVARHFGRR